jgi:hypothetical protein
MSRPNDKGYYRIDKQDVAERPFSFRPSDFLDPNQRSLKRISGFRIMTALCAGMVLMVAFISAITFSLPDLSIFPGHSRVVKLGVSQSTMEEGRSKCYAIRFRSEAKIKQKKSRKNPRAVKNQKPILIKNAVIWDGEGGIQENMDILMKDGIVQQIEEGIQLNPSLVDVTDIVDVRGHVVRYSQSILPICVHYSDFFFFI